MCRCTQSFTRTGPFKLLIAALLIIAASLSISAQSVDNQRLGKAMDVIDAQDKYISALEGKVKALETANAAQTSLIAIITKQRDDALAMKCQKTSFFFVYRKTRCY